MITTITQGIHNSILEAPYREVHLKKIRHLKFYAITTTMALSSQLPQELPHYEVALQYLASKSTHAVCLNPTPQ